jgi:hypothetical protein
MKKVLLIVISIISLSAFAQDEFRLEFNEETSRVFYQGVMTNDSLTKTELFTKGISYFERKGKKLSFKDESVGVLVGEAAFSTVGKKSAYGKSYYYNFTCEIRVEFKDGKTRWTFDNFKKKSSPGEPGSTLEYFIDNYAPTISSEKSRNREAKMLDQIEMAIAEQLEDMIEEMRTVFEPAKTDDW